MEYSGKDSRWVAWMGIQWVEDEGFLVDPWKEAVVGQGGHAPLGRGPRSLELFLPWLVVEKGTGTSESERRG
jgi:hypothetical protein